MNLRARFVFTIGLLGLLCLTMPGALRADDFTFSFTGSLGDENGSTLSSQTVTGEIYGLTNNMTSMATDVTITSFPAAYAYAADHAADPDLLTPVTDTFAPPWVVHANSFTEIGGAIAVADYVSYTTTLGGTEIILGQFNEYDLLSAELRTKKMAR